MQLYCFMTLQQLPWYNIGVVFHGRENNLITIVQELVSPRAGYKVDGFGCAASKDNLVCMAGIDISLYTTPGSFMSFSSLYAEGMYAAVYVGIYAIITVGNAVYHTLWMLRCSGVIEIDKGLMVYLLCKNGEL